MNSELKIEIERLQYILESNGLEFTINEPASIEKIYEIESKIGILFDENLKDLWLFSNGSKSSHYWFSVFSDELTFCSFSSIEDALKCWSWYEPYDDEIYKEWCDFESERDERIQPYLLQHRLWFPFAEFNNYSTSVIFDADPTELGKYGQIIVYQHDPDAIYYVAEDFLSFFKRSNDLLNAELKSYLSSI